jgi:hypothetical protein
MAILVGQTTWQAPCLVKAAAVGSSVLGGTLICKAGGIAWIIAPTSTQVTTNWTDNIWGNTQVTARCCTCDWPSVSTALANAGFNPSQWFIPSCGQLQNPGFVCRSRWDSPTPTATHWSANDSGPNTAVAVQFDNANARNDNKSISFHLVRAMRCVTYT